MGMKIYAPNLSFMELKIMEKLSGSKIPYLFRKFYELIANTNIKGSHCFNPM